MSGAGARAGGSGIPRAAPPPVGPSALTPQDPPGVPAGLRTRGQPAAVAAIRAMLGTGVPHALLFTGPPGTGKTTLALDLAAALMCAAPTSGARPCGECRGCRMVEHGNHPDVHRLAPVGAGGVIPIGGRDDRGVRDLVAELAFLPVEGGARVAIVESMHRMTEDAQSAFLKTLEEPPARTTIVLCADEEDRLLPTVRSRCVRIRLGSMGPREIATVLAERGLADAAIAARLSRLAEGRPGLAIAYAAAPEAAAIRSEIARTLLDVLGSSRTRRLTVVRDLAGRAAEMARSLEVGVARASTMALGDDASSSSPSAPARRGARTRRSGGPSAPATDPAPDATGSGTADDVEAAGATEVADLPPTRIPPAERRKGALALVAIWRAVLRDVALVGLGDPSAVVDTDLLDDLGVSAAHLPPADAAAFLRRLEVAGERLEGNVSPELVLDVLALAWRSTSSTLHAR